MLQTPPIAKCGIFNLNNGQTANVCYLFDKENRGHCNYLQAAAVGIKSELTERQYRRAEPVYTEALAQIIGKQIDSAMKLGVINPPSTRTDALPYKEKICSHIVATDLSFGYGPKSGNKAVRGVSVEEWKSSNPYTCSGSETELDHVLIIDDILGIGTTASAIVEHLQGCGLTKSALVTIVVPFWTTA